MRKVKLMFYLDLPTRRIDVRSPSVAGVECVAYFNESGAVHRIVEVEAQRDVEQEYYPKMRTIKEFRRSEKETEATQRKAMAKARRYCTDIG